MKVFFKEGELLKYLRENIGNSTNAEVRKTWLWLSTRRRYIELARVVEGIETLEFQGIDWVDIMSDCASENSQEELVLAILEVAYGEETLPEPLVCSIWECAAEYYQQRQRKETVLF